MIIYKACRRLADTPLMAIFLVNLNRGLVNKGLEKLKNNPSNCFKYLMENIDKNYIDTEFIGYNIAPYINVAGRLKTGDLAVTCLKICFSSFSDITGMSLLHLAIAAPTV